jgi:hypothetical protein
MNIGERRSRIGWTVAVALAGAVIGVTGCRPTPTAASGGGTRPPFAAAAANGEHVQGMAGSAVAPGRPAGARPAGRLVNPAAHL